MELSRKPIWNYDDDGFLTGQDVAIESPLERGSGIFLIPRNSTDVPPPDRDAGKEARWNGTAWELVNARTVNYEIAAQKMGESIRDARNRLLYACDWTQLPDVPKWVDVQAWRTYRQALRDLPQQGGFPGKITWPNPPARG